MALTYHCESAEIERLLRRMEEIAARDGSTFSDRTVIREADGNLWVETKDKSPTDEPMMFLSRDCLSPVHETKYELQDGQMVILDIPADWPQVRRQLFEIMIEIYNISGKFSSARDSFPVLSLADHPRILERLAASRAPMNLATHRKLVKEQGLENAVIAEFLKSRSLNYKAGENDKVVPCLMPMVDFFNHHIKGAIYGNEDGGLHMMQASPETKSAECFAFYGMYDSMTMLFNYGYPDRSAGIVAAPPMDIDLPGLGTIAVKGTQLKFQGNLDKSFEALKPYFPAINIADSTARVSKLVFPSTEIAPRALARILGAVIHRLARSRGLEANKDLVRLAESQVFLNTMEFYLSLEAFLADPDNVAGAHAPTIDNAKTTVAHLLGNLRSYRMAS